MVVMRSLISVKPICDAFRFGFFWVSYFVMRQSEMAGHFTGSYNGPEINRLTSILLSECPAVGHFLCKIAAVA